jgi:hypothetical protein
MDIRCITMILFEVGIDFKRMRLFVERRHGHSFPVNKSISHPELLAPHVEDRATHVT